MDLTYVLDNQSAKRFVSGTDLNLFHKTSIRDMDADFLLISLCFDDDFSEIFVESIASEEGKYKDHSTDILVLNSTLPVEVYNHFETEAEYSRLLKFD